MASETIVAVFESMSQAETAIADLVANGVAHDHIEHYTQDASTDVSTTTNAGDTRSHGFWAWLTGDADESRDHHALYEHSVRSGSTVVTVVTDGANTGLVHSVLEKHHPVDLDARHDEYSKSGAYDAYDAAPGRAAGTTTEQVIGLSEETLQVGKRAVDRGTTRVRKYVVERPVEEQVRLRNETVSVFRRPATSATAGHDAFTDREVVVTETDEEAVVAKNARVVEEVVVQKGSEERVETIRDTVRKEEVEIDGPHGDKVGQNRI